MTRFVSRPYIRYNSKLTTVYRGILIILGLYTGRHATQLQQRFSTLFIYRCGILEDVFQTMEKQGNSNNLPSLFYSIVCVLIPGQPDCCPLASYHHSPVLLITGFALSTKTQCSKQSTKNRIIPHFDLRNLNTELQNAGVPYGLC